MFHIPQRSGKDERNLLVIYPTSCVLDVIENPITECRSSQIVDLKAPYLSDLKLHLSLLIWT